MFQFWPLEKSIADQWVNYWMSLLCSQLEAVVCSGAFYLQLCLGALVLTIGASLLTIGAFMLIVGAF